MKTCCPDCQTVFRVTAEQLKVRAGKVRCGQCRKVFNALEVLLDDSESVVVPLAAGAAAAPVSAEGPVPSGATAKPAPAPAPAVAVLLREEQTDASGDDAPTSVEPEDVATGEPADAASAAWSAETPADGIPGPLPGTNPAGLRVEPSWTTSEPATTDAQADSDEQRRMPRETRALPGYDKWLEGAISKRVPPVAGKAPSAPFVIAIVLLVLALVGQIIFHFRGVIALAAPATRPALAALSAALGTEIPLPRHVDLVSIEASDLQTEAGRNKLLALQATLRNRASYAQAYPALELTLTDTADKAIVRRVFMPDEYLPPRPAAEDAFGANQDIDVRLWLEARDVNAAGYRLYVFYP
ncbi:MAG: DUF3426 domain-containing protein [Candidatus Accumulibacter sp.]|nr:DUF3426 domain-containing protein [Accumulibacter sp.]